MIRPGLPAAILASCLGTAAAAQTIPELSYGLSVTSNYIDKGTSQSDDRPALQGYVEASYGLAYAGAWSSTVDLDGDTVELDLYAGIRPSFGELSVDLGYFRYLYDETGDCCGEFVLLLLHPMADIGDVGFEFDYDPVFDTKWADLIVAVSFREVYEAGGNIGTDFGTQDFGEDKIAWNLGVSRALTDFSNADLRYYDSNFDPARAVVSINLDF
jgi:uncharacterized protein (TIGR02001 family)